MLAVCDNDENSLNDGAFLYSSFFCQVYNYAEKADLSKGYWNLKRKLGVTSHISEIINLATIIILKGCKIQKNL